MIANSKHEIANEYLIRGLWCYLFTLGFFTILFIVNNFSLSAFLLYFGSITAHVLLYYNCICKFGENLNFLEIAIPLLVSVSKFFVYLLTWLLKINFQNELPVSAIQLDLIVNCILYKTVSKKFSGLLINFFLTFFCRYIFYPKEIYISLDAILSSIFIIFLSLLTQTDFLQLKYQIHKEDSYSDSDSIHHDPLDNIRDLASAIDEFDIDIAIISITENEKLSLVTATSKFMKSYSSYRNIENFFQTFSRSNMQMPERPLTLDNSKKNRGALVHESNKHNLLSDLKEYLNDVKIIKSNIQHFPQKNLYFITSEDSFDLRSSLPITRKCEYYEVQFLMKRNTRGGDSIWLMFRSINREKYYSKQQQVLAFGNILTSSLTHELKNPINGLYGLIYSIQNEVESNLMSEVIEKLIEKEKAVSSDMEYNSLLSIVPVSGVTDGFKLYMDKLLQEMDFGSSQNKEAENKIKSILLCKWLHSRNVLNMNLGTNKYLLKKTKLIVENLEIFSKIKFNLPFNFNVTEVNLEYLLKKCFKLLHPIVDFTKSSLTIDIDQSSSKLVKGSHKYLRILIQNIILLLEKRMSKSMISVNVALENKDNITSTLEVKFVLKHGSYYGSIKGEEITDNNDIEMNLEVIDIFNKNNKKLSSMMNLEYSTRFIQNEKTLQFSIKFNQFLPCNMKLLDDSILSEDKDNSKRNDFNESSERGFEMMNLNLWGNRNNSREDNNSGYEIKLKPPRKMSMFFHNIRYNDNNTPEKNLDFLQYRSGGTFFTDDNSKENYDPEIDEYTEDHVIHFPQFYSGVIRKFDMGKILAKDEQNRNRNRNRNNCQQNITPNINSFSTEAPYDSRKTPTCEKKSIPKFKKSKSSDLNNQLVTPKCIFPHVLIVDDDKLSINYLQNTATLAEKSYELAFNGEEAYEKCKMIININMNTCTCQKRELVILMDICMPVMNGIDSAKLIDNYIKNFGIGIKCRLYFISGNSDSQFFNFLNEISICQGYLAKPVSKKEILKIIK